ncbi:unnamed protein product, partial [Allacma fusca]
MSIFKLFLVLALVLNGSNSEPSLAPVKVNTIDLQELLPSLINCFIRIFEMNSTFDYSTLTVPFVMTNVNSYEADGNIPFGKEYSSDEQRELLDSQNIAILKLPTIKCFAGIIVYEKDNLLPGESLYRYIDFKPLQDILANEYSLWYFWKNNKKVEHVKKLRVSPRLYFVCTNSVVEKLTGELNVDFLILENLRSHDDTLTYFRIVYHTSHVTPVEVRKHANELYYINFKCDCSGLYEFKCPYLKDRPVYDSLSSCYKNLIKGGKHLFAWSTDDIGNQGVIYCKSNPIIQRESFGIMKATGIFLREDYNQTLKEEICSLRSIYSNPKAEEPLNLFIATSRSKSPEGNQFYMVG